MPMISTSSIEISDVELDQIMAECEPDIHFDGLDIIVVE